MKLVLKTFVHLFMGVVGLDFPLIDDNVRPHRAHLVDDFLEIKDIHLIDWTARSPDFNLIEHV